MSTLVRHCMLLQYVDADSLFLFLFFCLLNWCLTFCTFKQANLNTSHRRTRFGGPYHQPHIEVSTRIASQCVRYTIYLTNKIVEQYSVLLLEYKNAGKSLKLPFLMPHKPMVFHSHKFLNSILSMSRNQLALSRTQEILN